jgi:hypothetical protein
MFAGFRSRWPLLVRGVERLGDLFCDHQRLVYWHSPAGDPLGEVFAVDELHQRACVPPDFSNP